ncbi:MAG: virulence factor family protein, partial [Pseudomonas sp.]|nr:virulence factor family protein [Pseudomonas sp.]
MTRRFWLYPLITLLLAALAGATAFWFWTRPAPEAQLEQLQINDAS